jgi:hypothetical protein
MIDGAPSSAFPASQLSASVEPISPRDISLLFMKVCSHNAKSSNSRKNFAALLQPIHFDHLQAPLIINWICHHLDNAAKAMAKEEVGPDPLRSNG